MIWRGTDPTYCKATSDMFSSSSASGQVAGERNIGSETYYDLLRKLNLKIFIVFYFWWEKRSHMFI